MIYKECKKIPNKLYICYIFEDNYDSRISTILKWKTIVEFDFPTIARTDPEVKCFEGDGVDGYYGIRFIVTIEPPNDYVRIK